MAAPKTLARIAGSLYLLVAVFTVFAGVVNTRLVEPGNAAATADNIRASVALFRIGFLSELVGAVCFLLTAMVLYRLLKHVSRAAAAAMVTVVAVSVAIQSLNLLNQSAGLMAATGQGPTGAFGPVGSDRLAMLFVDMYHDGYLIAQTYFGLWLLPLGYLVAKSGYFPKVLGVLLVIGCLGHLTDVFARLLAPGFGAAVSPWAMTPAAVAELAFIAWLLVKAVRVPVPEARIPGAVPAA
ncbi:DUF4386 domain-containing protein [Streptomonospora algeriensis]|uniref:DUF4386 domain-containing protein n=1 Tax=Streptomonospora algeriensis TaxID=995084 RepID=A0ABW3BCN3_9ACTN